MALIGDNQVRMANICAYTANSINGVSKLHSEIIKDSVFHDYYLFKPQAFKNVTNGIAYRRWLLASNPGLCKLLDETIGDGYKHDASDLSKLNKFENDKTVLKQLNADQAGQQEELCQLSGRRAPVRSSTRTPSLTARSSVCTSTSAST